MVVSVLDPPRVALGVGSDGDEQSLASVWGSHSGSGYDNPSDMHPVFGHVPDHSVESEAAMAVHVLQECEAGS